MAAEAIDWAWKMSMLLATPSDWSERRFMQL